MPENTRLSGSVDQIELGFAEREATPRLLTKLDIQHHLAFLSLSNIDSIFDMSGIKRARSTVHNWVHKADLQPGSGQCPDHISVDETVIRLNAEQYWLYAAVDPETSELLHTKHEPTRTNVLAHSLLTELSEKHGVGDVVFPVDGSHSLQDACHRHGFDFRGEKYGNRNSIERIFRKIKRRTVCFSNCFSNAGCVFRLDRFLALFDTDYCGVHLPPLSTTADSSGEDTRRRTFLQEILGRAPASTPARQSRSLGVIRGQCVQTPATLSKSLGSDIF